MNGILQINDYATLFIAFSVIGRFIDERNTFLFHKNYRNRKLGLPTRLKVIMNQISIPTFVF